LISIIISKMLRFNKKEKNVEINSFDYGYICYKLLLNEFVYGYDMIQMMKDNQCVNCGRKYEDYNFQYLNNVDWENVNFEKLFVGNANVLTWCPCGYWI